MKTLILALMAFASAQTGLPVPDRLPNVIQKPACEIRLMHSAEADCDGDFGANALYYSGTIVLKDSWSADDLFDVSALLHELVHHLQFEAGMLDTGDSICHGEKIEKPAYEAQFAFLEAAGVEDPISFIGMNAFYYWIVTSCLRDGY